MIPDWGKQENLKFRKQKIIYSQTCTKRSPLGQRKSDIIRQMTSQKRFTSYEIFYDGKKKMTF
jgi:hypothetical protein